MLVLEGDDDDDNDDDDDLVVLEGEGDIPAITHGRPHLPRMSPALHPHLTRGSKNRELVIICNYFRI